MKKAVTTTEEKGDKGLTGAVTQRWLRMFFYSFLALITGVLYFCLCHFWVCIAWLAW